MKLVFLKTDVFKRRKIESKHLLGPYLPSPSLPTSLPPSLPPTTLTWMLLLLPK